MVPLLVSHEVFDCVLKLRLDYLGLEISVVFLFGPKNKFFLLNEFILIVFVNLQKLFVHNLLGRPHVLSFVVIELYQQRVQVLALEVYVECVPLAVQAVVVEELRLVGVVFLWVCHRHRHHRGANRALHQPLTLVLLRLRFLHREHVVAVLTVEILDLILEAEPAQAFLAFETDVHFFFDKLSSATALVVHIGSSEFRQPVHIFSI